MTRILLLDDEPLILSALRRALYSELALPGLRIDTFSNPYQALQQVCVCDYDLAIADYRMPQMSGVTFLQALKDTAPHTVRMMLSGSTEFETAMSAINEAHVFRFITKPWQAVELQENIRAALAHRAQLLAEHGIAPAAAIPLTPQELEAQRLEAEEPGILTVRRAPDGSIIL